MNSPSIAIAGGGVAGLATAHHLCRAGVKNITVYEASDKVGGKARSQYLTDDHGARYPGEHGFRFFPHFYRHLLETLRQIPVSDGSVWDRLRGPEVGAIAYRGDLIKVKRPIEVGANFDFVKTTVEILMRPEVSIKEATRFAGRLLQFASSCDERRRGEYDNVSWSNFTGADRRPYSREFEDIVIRASQNLSAMRAKTSSAATIGAITLQLLFTTAPGERADALLRSPTDEAWLDDWRSHLEEEGVRFHTSARLTAVDFDEIGGRVQGLHFDGVASPVIADHYVIAIPLERIVDVLNDKMMRFDPALGALPALKSQALGNMTGLQFFLRRPVPIAPGHVHYPGTPFALTSISQGQFWTPTPADRADAPASLQDVLSVIISDWDAPGTEKKPASAYQSRKELAMEAWRQMKSALPAGTLRDEDILEIHVDANVRLLRSFTNDNPLLIHPLGQYERRPDAETAIENLFLASDFVRTYTDLATMEGADEAARRATRGILDRIGVAETAWPAIRPLEESRLFDLAKAQDRMFYNLGLSHIMESRFPRFGPLSDAVLASVDSANAARLRSIRAKRSELPPLDRDEITVDELEQWEMFLRNPPSPAP
jgi:uncharacterized protein with NAD-binding domain and iron-sulfur cluster